MTSPWLDRLPTAEEVEAHAAAHGVEYGCAGRIGLWMLREEHEPVPLCGELQLGRGGAEGWDYLWNPHIGEHEGGDTVKLGPGDRLCPLTADGMPVALVTEVEQLRAELAAERAVSERLRAWFTGITNTATADLPPCPRCVGCGEVPE